MSQGGGFLWPMTKADVHLQQLAATCGPLSRDVVLKDLSEDQVKRRVASGALVVPHRGIYLVPAIVNGYAAQLRTALLAAKGRAVVSHRSAAALWGFPVTEPTVPEITVLGSWRPDVKDALIHRVRALERVDWTTRGGLAVTTPAVTLLDCGFLLEPDEYERCFEYGLYRDLVTFRRMHRVLERLGGRGRPGTAALRALLDSRDPALAPTESELEFITQKMIDRYGAPQPSRQRWIVTPDNDRFRLDFPYVDIRLALEVDGRVCHSGRRDFVRDRQRTRALVRMGWAPLPYTWPEIRRHARAVAAEITEEVTRRRSLLASER
jgi:very-short-patch-repair endonuclease